MHRIWCWLGRHEWQMSLAHRSGERELLVWQCARCARLRALWQD